MGGTYSYNDGAGLYRLSSFAGFVKYNMPLSTDYHDPKLTDEDAWDVAAFVNSQPRPHKDQSADWKNIAKNLLTSLLDLILIHSQRNRISPAPLKRLKILINQLNKHYEKIITRPAKCCITNNSSHRTNNR
ncbi:MAG: hypothetical protein NVS1B13_10140 [Flavisolibacter sp.]